MTSTTTQQPGGQPPSGMSTKVVLAIIVAALGYFVDIFDLILFGIIRTDSLNNLGLDPQTAGETLLGWQMIGFLIGGIIWGIFGDKRGRLSVLFGSILMYSLANILNGFVGQMGFGDVLTTYAVLRFIAGVGLAGELGAGITLVSELMSKEQRGWGTTMVATFGLLGAVAANLVGGADWGWGAENWRIAYYVGGALGLALLVLRIGVHESGMYKSLMGKGHIQRGDFGSLFNPLIKPLRGQASQITSGDWRRMKRYLQCILIGVPIWYVVGILIIFAPEFTAALNLPPDIQAAAQKHDGDIIMICYIGLAVGDLGSGVMSQVLKSRRRAVYIFMSFTFAMTLFYLNMNRLGITPNLTHLYILSFLLGFGTGYWAVFVTNAAEQFGTNIRSTVTTTVPNFVRGSLELVLIVYGALRGAKIAPGQYEGLGMIDSALLVGIVVFLIAFVSLYFLPEGYGKDLDYIEEEELASEPTQPAGAEQ